MRALKGISASSVAGLRTRVVGIARPSSLHSVAVPTSASHIFAKSVKISYRQSKQSSFTTRAGAGSMMDEFEGPDAAVLMQNPDVQEVTFSKLPGVLKTRVGYTGGHTSNPTYGSVCGGDGHTEAMRVWFDSKQVTYAQLLQLFFEEHNPSGRSKVQYKSAVWYHDDDQRVAVESAIAGLKSKYKVPISTTLDPVKEWWDAEEYHQKYIAKQSLRWR